MTAAVLEVAGVERVCGECGESFFDRSRTAPRSYCYSCRPVGGRPPAPAKREPVKGKPFTVAHFRRWSARFKLKDGRPFALEPYQAAFLEDLFARDADGRKTYAELWLVVPEGNGKTTFFALVVLYTVEHVAEAWCPIAASSRDQGVDLTYRIAAGFVKRNGLEAGAPDYGPIRLHPGYRQIVDTGSGGAAKVFASDAAGGDGTDPTLALIEELHRLDSMELYETWSGKLDKSDGQLIVASTAGEPGSAFEELRETIRQQATDVRRDGCYLRAAGGAVVLHEYAIPEDGDPENLELVAAANPFSAKTVEALARKRAKPTWSLAHWLRFTCNRATRSVDAAISEREWVAAGLAAEIPAGAPVTAGLDLGWKIDTTALVPLWDGPEFRLLGPATILEPPRDGSMLPVDAVKRALLDLHERNPIVLLVMDMSDGADVAQWASDELGIPVEDRPQGNAAKVAEYAAFMRGLRDGSLRHSRDPGLTRHAMNAVARVLPGGDTRFDRPKRARVTSDRLQRARVIDALMAAAMAVDPGVVEEEEELGIVFIGGAS